MRFRNITTHLLHGAAYCALCIVHCALTSSCTDWTDHYDDATGSGATAGVSLYEQIATRSDLSDFCRVLDATHVYANNRPTELSYAELLKGDQFFTVFALQNGTFNCDSLLALCGTQEGDSLVGTHFVSNHIARYRHSAGDNEQVLMLGGKTQHLSGNYMGGAPIAEANTPARNGILHVMKTDYQYRYNIYEALVSLGKYSHLGQFLRRYQVSEFDPLNSLEQGIVDGKTVYADSVFYTRNDVLRRIDAIDCEDSTFIMFVPTAELWSTIFAEARAHYAYPYDAANDGDKVLADSMQNFWSHYALMQDLVFNPVWQTSPRDSLTTTTWYRGGYPYHVYYRPYEQGGLMSYVTDSTVCSNGVIYEMKEWPFDNTKLYFQKIEVEGEDRGALVADYETATKSLTLNRFNISADTVSGGYIYIKPVTPTDAYYVEYELPDVLCGDYDIKIICLPKTVFDPSFDPNSKKSTDRLAFRSCKFLATVTYAGTDGKLCTVESRKKYDIVPSAPSYYVLNKEGGGNYVMTTNYIDNKAKDPEASIAFTTNPYRVDTIQLATFHFPVSNYAQTKCTSRLKIINNVGSKENTVSGFSGDLLIDKILLIPHKDETQE